jgi:hypothetical protein
MFSGQQTYCVTHLCAHGNLLKPQATGIAAASGCKVTIVMCHAITYDTSQQQQQQHQQDTYYQNSGYQYPDDRPQNQGTVGQQQDECGQYDRSQQMNSTSHIPIRD